MGILVLSRAASEGIVMILPDGSEIVVQVNHFKGRKVSLGIIAPAKVKVLRRELHANKKGTESGSLGVLAVGGESGVVLSGLPASRQVAVG